MKQGISSNSSASSGTAVESIEWDESDNRVSTSVRCGEERFTLSYSSNQKLSKSSDFLLPGLLLSAMKQGGSLKLPGGVSQKLLSASDQIQDIFNMWESVFGRVEIRTDDVGEAYRRDLAASRGVACIFGGGVDSMHTLMRHYDEITHLLYLHLPTDDPQVKERARHRVSEIARLTSKTMIEVETNFRDIHREQRILWKFGHGPWVMASTLLFQDTIRKAYIPGSTTSNYDNLRPQGTHPILDPLWSTESLEFFHDGCEVRRVDKARDISEYDVAMKWLQVCDLGRGGSNCGTCKKCLRTMVNLRAANALEKCETLPDEIDLEAIRALDLSEYSESYFARENLRSLESSGVDPELAVALREAIEKGAAIIAHSGYREENVAKIHEKLDLVRKRNNFLRSKNKELRASLSGRNADSKRRRYVLADRVAESIRKVPYSGRLLKTVNRFLLSRKG